MATQHGGQGGGSISLVSSTALTSTSGKQNRVKVAIEPDASQKLNAVSPLLLDFEHNVLLTEILQDFCNRWNIENPERYSFKHSDSKSKGAAAKAQGKYGYLTEQNLMQLNPS